MIWRQAIGGVGGAFLVAKGAIVRVDGVFHNDFLSPGLSPGREG